MAAHDYVPIPNDGTTRKLQNRKRTVGANDVFSQVVEELKDVGRSNLLWTISRVAAASAAETILTFKESVDGGATADITSKLITSGKRMRIMAAQLSIEAGGTTPDWSRNLIRLRASASGDILTSSPLQAIWQVEGSEVAKRVTNLVVQFPDGIELMGDGSREVGLTWECMDYVVTTVVPVLTATLFGFEFQD